MTIRASLVASLLAAFVLLLVAAPPANADATLTIGPTCGSCFGGTYKLSFTGDNSGSTFTVRLTITTPSTGVVAGQYISAVDFSDSKKIASLSLTGTNAGAVGDWTTVTDNLSNNGCGQAPLNATFGCSYETVTPYNLALANGTTYYWEWTVTFNKPGLDTNLADMHIGAKYEDAGGSNGHIVSENGTTQVPEPSTLVLLGTGLLGMGWFRRRS